MKKFYFETSKPHESPLVRMPPKRNISVAKFLPNPASACEPSRKTWKKAIFHWFYMWFLPLFVFLTIKKGKTKWKKCLSWHVKHIYTKLSLFGFGWCTSINFWLFRSRKQQFPPLASSRDSTILALNEVLFISWRLWPKYSY